MICLTRPRRTLIELGALVVALPVLSTSAVAGHGSSIPPPRSIAEFCANPTAAPFTDVSGTGDANAAELGLAVRCLATADVAQGNPAGIGADRYGPTLNVTRGQMASFIARMIDASVARETSESAVKELPPAAQANPFPGDVPDDYVHLNNIKRLQQAGIATGNPGGIGADKYGPEEFVTRAQMASFLNRAVAHIEGGDVSKAGSAQPHGFAAPDANYYVDPLPDNHADNIRGITSAGIAQGGGNETYGSAGNVSRQQMARFIPRTLAALNASAGDQRVLTLLESYSAGFTDEDRQPDNRGCCGEGGFGAMGDRGYRATGLDPAVEYRMTLVRADLVSRATTTTNQVTFERDMSQPATSRGNFVVMTGIDASSPQASFSFVNEAAPENNAQRDAPRNQQYGPTAVARPKADGTLTFNVQSNEAVISVIPLIYVNGGPAGRSLSDGGDSPRLEIDADGRPVEFVGVAGRTDFEQTGG